VNVRVEELLEEIGLTERRDLAAGTLSHGDQRLLEIGLAMAPIRSFSFSTNLRLA